MMERIQEKQAEKKNPLTTSSIIATVYKPVVCCDAKDNKADSCYDTDKDELKDLNAKVGILIKSLS